MTRAIILAIIMLAATSAASLAASRGSHAGDAWGMGGLAAFPTGPVQDCRQRRVTCDDGTSPLVLQALREREGTAARYRGELCRSLTGQRQQDECMRR